MARDQSDLPTPPPPAGDGPPNDLDVAYGAAVSYTHLTLPTTAYV